MAITELIAATSAAVALTDTSTRFTAAGPFVLYGDGFSYKASAGQPYRENASQEKAVLYRLGPKGTYIPATNKEGEIFVGARPNMVYVDAAGDYQIVKDATVTTAAVGYEEV